MNRVNKFLKLFCTEKTDKGHQCFAYLGDIQIDTPNTARFYCKNHGYLFEVTSDGAGGVTRAILDKAFRTETLESVAIVEA